VFRRNKTLKSTRKSAYLFSEDVKLSRAEANKIPKLKIEKKEKKSKTKKSVKKRGADLKKAHKYANIKS